MDKLIKLLHEGNYSCVIKNKEISTFTQRGITDLYDLLNTDKVSCGNCARHCPTGAIQMIPEDENDESSPKIPVVNTERCIGCGACENLCPSRPFSAIYVEGHEMHRII